MDREFNKQFKRLNKIENKILNKKENTLLKSKTAPIMDKLQEKIPKKLKLALEAAFLKSFKLVFEKGNTYIEKTYSKDRIKLEHDLNNYAIDKKLCNKYIKRLDTPAKHSKRLNSTLTILEGGVLGLLGIGLPDIPLLISMIMKTMYEIALSYGYDYESNEEKTYILLIICGALVHGEKKKEISEQIDQLGTQIDTQSQIDITLDDQMNRTAHILSEAMLTAKFIQGIPFIGVIGGVVNFNIIDKIGKFAAIKYKKRYLLKKAREKNVQI
ncbi:MAG: EcsC family protein [Epulopiscium sp.]|nr:EcsC family protein [Candidatus Epulonipiscium sp.]